MRRLAVAVAVTSLALLVAPLFRPKPVLSTSTAMVIGPEGDFKNIAEFDVWLASAGRTAESPFLTVTLKGNQSASLKWMNSLDLVNNNMSVYIECGQPLLGAEQIVHAAHFDVQQ